ncbi:hypothetical protein BUALT_Bualt03G0118800 [Buddleja alternifolia]|uniref:Uncharacterized protein n=1 Tax=Buddleja alternifolia TaxID=168488 RepID=A0AAV6Y1F4_9LAMI|nr:hypothetical protein BUALT_Bualt03G0118800 [Buddleja alternifolia]
MPQTLSNSTTKTRPKNISTQQNPPTYIANTKEMMHISNSFGSLKLTAKSDPVAIGTRGTVGSLIMQEMEYFSRVEPKRPPRQISVLATTREVSRSKPEPVITIPGKRKRISNRLIPRMCSMVEVAESKKPNAVVSGFTYRNLKADLKRLLLVVWLEETETEVHSEGALDVDFVESISLDMRASIVPVVPTLTDPPPPLIASNGCAMVFQLV